MTRDGAVESSPVLPHLRRMVSGWHLPLLLLACALKTQG